MTGERVIAGELTVGGRPRSFALRLPQGAGAGIPLVLVLHGNHPDAGGWIMREWTTFDQQADVQGLAVAYPDGYGGCWADGRGVTTADEAGVDDVAFLARDHRLVGRTARDVRRSRAWWRACPTAHSWPTGWRSTRATRWRCWPPSRAGCPRACATCRPTHAVSAMLIHGTADTISPIAGGYSRHRGPDGELRGRTLSLDETAGFWRAVDRCLPGSDDTRTTEFSSRTRQRVASAGPQVTAWTVFGGGHTWPGSAPVPGVR